ncbi:MAG: hypothetical protein K0S46_40 [Moraxellaceae bacterium]|jgi:hypothetical protein|nr:hypothetical protein [Moraxellaceae bacterium]
MMLQRLRETLFFFWHHLTDLLWRLAPVLPLLAMTNYLLFVVHDGDTKAAMADPLTLAPQLLAGVMAAALTIRYSLAVVRKETPGFGALWRGALADTLPLALVQIMAGVLIVAGLFLLILPGLFLMGALLPAYVILIQERTGPLGALKASWQRFRSQAWAVSASLFAVFLLLMVVMSGLDALGQLLDAAPLPLRLAALSGLDLVGLLFSQMVVILLVRFYELEQLPPAKAGWN